MYDVWVPKSLRPSRVAVGESTVCAGFPAVGDAGDHSDWNFSEAIEYSGGARPP